MNTVVRTKIEVNPANARNISGLDDLARIVFPDNRAHRKVFVAIWLEIKYAENQFLSSRFNLCAKYGLSSRTLEVVRARMKKLGFLKRISHFNPRYGSVSGWTFGDSFVCCLVKLAEVVRQAKRPAGRKIDEQKDRDSITYV